jgi:adenosylcobinamide-phosphate synthase
MSFLAILFALLLEQARPLGEGNPVHQGVRGWVRWVLRNLDAGKPQHGWLAWWVAVVLPAALVFGVEHRHPVFHLGFSPVQPPLYGCSGCLAGR